jgi:hypothetical protein
VILIAQLRGDGEIQTRRSAADAHDLHVLFRLPG